MEKIATGVAVAVLGCGPAGLMAAAAADALGAEVRILSKKRKSEMFGSQYLHSPIPGFTSKPPVNIRYQLQGSAEGYRHKVYGSLWDGTVSPEDYEADHDGWDIRDTYNQLWARFVGAIEDVSVDPLACERLMDSGVIVISSIPAVSLCTDIVHMFKSTPVYACGDAPERGVFAPFAEMVPANFVLCSGLEFDLWYRLSNIYGHVTVEWPFGNRQPHPQANVVDKPLATDCNCLPGAIRVGRYGRWQKGVLSHSAYWDTMQALETRLCPT